MQKVAATKSCIFDSTTLTNVHSRGYAVTIHMQPLKSSQSATQTPSGGMVGSSPPCLPILQQMNSHHQPAKLGNAGKRGTICTVWQAQWRGVWCPYRACGNFACILAAFGQQLLQLRLLVKGSTIKRHKSGCDGNVIRNARGGVEAQMLYHGHSTPCAIH